MISEELKEFFKTLTIAELYRAQDEAREVGDAETLEALLQEGMRRALEVLKEKGI